MRASSWRSLGRRLNFSYCTALHHMQEIKIRDLNDVLLNSELDKILELWSGPSNTGSSWFSEGLIGQGYSAVPRFETATSRAFELLQLFWRQRSLLVD